jgi:hypothetical protein
METEFEKSAGEVNFPDKLGPSLTGGGRTT